MGTDLATFPQDLVLLQQAVAILDQCQSLDEVKDLRDKAEAIRLYRRKIGDSQRAQNAAAEVKIRAERRLGELLAEMPKHNGDPRLHDATRLSDLGIEKTLSHRCQAIAAVPAERFEEVIARAIETNNELTSKAVYDLGRIHQKQARRAELVQAAQAIEATGDIHTGDLGLLNELLPDNSAEWGASG
jgi:hypothetical protein